MARSQYKPCLLTVTALSFTYRQRGWPYSYHLPKTFGNSFGQNVNGKAVLARLTGKSRNKLNVFKGSPKFPAKISVVKNVHHLQLSWDYDQAELVLLSLSVNWDF